MKTGNGFEPDTRFVSPPIQDDPLISGASITGGDAGVFSRHDNTWIQAIDDWSTWLDACNRTEDTIYQYRWRIRGLADTYRDRSPWKLAMRDLINWYVRPEWGAGMRNNARSALRSFYEWAIKDGRTKRNPAADLPSIIVAQGLPRPADEGVLQRAMAEADDRTRLMLALGGYGGLRDMEIAGLRWCDITDTQMIVTGKGRKTRTVWLHEVVAAELRAERTRRSAGKRGTGYRYARDLDVFVFPSQHGGPMSANRVSQVLSEALGPGTTGHQLRHRFATEILNETGDIAVVQDLLGHASPATTRVYARVSDRRLRDAVNSIK